MSGQGCGACHQNGANPDIVDGACTTCERTAEQIEKDHGFVYLDKPVENVVIGVSYTRKFIGRKEPHFVNDALQWVEDNLT